MASVNVPTNNKQKEKDINAKLQLFGIYEAFAKGKVPSNKQIDVAMNSALQWDPLKNPPKKLSTEGQQLVGDLRDVIEKAKILLLSKNQGNLLQDFIWQTQGVGAGNAQKPGAPVDKETAKQQGNEAAEGLKTLGNLLLTNGQFRKLLSDMTVLLRDIAADTAQKTAEKARPNEEQMNQIDVPAEDNTWHEKPDLSKENLKNQAKSRAPIGKKEAKEAAGDAAEAAHPEGSRDPTDAAALAARDQHEGTQSGVDAKSATTAGGKSLKNKFSENMTEEQKEKMRQYRERTNNYFKNKMPKERRDQLVFRLKKMVVEIQGHQDYSKAIDTLLRLAEEYTGHTKNVAGQGQGAVKGAHDQDTLKSAETDLITLLERFANSTSFDDLKEAVNQIYRDADNDPELKDWFKDMNQYIRKCLQEQGYILEESSNERWHKLYDQGNFLLRERYRNHTNRVFDEVKFLAGQFDEDAQNKAFAESMNKLFKDLGNDQDGKPQFKPHLVKDLTEVILPGFFENIRYVPIPRIEYSDKMVDAVIENLVIEGDNLAPNMFEFGSDNYWRWGRKSIQNKNKNKVMLSVSGVQMDLRDVAFYIKRKEGFPSITDKGLMDVFLGGTGLSFKVAMETADKSDKEHFFKINNVTVDIQHMSLKLKQSNHKLLFALFKPMLMKVMRPVIQKVAEKQIRENVQKLDAFCYRINREAERAKEEAKNNPDPEHVQNMYQRYFNAFQREMQKGKEKKEQAKEKVADKQVNMAVTQHDSIFKNISLPGGISSKATEYRELAQKGEKWESPVFSLGSAGETNNLPPVSDPKRKPHNATPMQLRDASSAGGAAGAAGAGGAAGATTNGGYTNGNTSGFANQVDGAFGGKNENYGGGLMSGQSNGPTTDITGQSGQHTTLGSNNPVFQGQA
ncbi:hypothetical protein D0868_15793 [Hortaea werneckii]|uniref:Uncharacterized protein n=1 Tax=Hortaea werneckii TaxID=91943 RepID=A0A3M6WWQ9_HORWE|nr:hypothetical protein D0868_15793 [Hortaea werneckii]